MRVTMNSIYANILTNLGGLTKDMNRINMQISSGKLMSKISDNPVNLINALGFRTTLSEIGQYQRNLKFGTTVISASENALVHIKDLTMRAKTLALQQANAPMTPENRQNAAMEVKNLWEQAIILANSSVNGKYIFGGFRTTGYTPAEPAPFVQGARDGYFINGQGMQPMTTRPTSAPMTNDTGGVDAGALSINGVPTNADIVGGAVIDGINVEKAFSAKVAINAISGTTGVAATLTTQISSSATSNATAEGTISFGLNGESISVEIVVGATATDVNNALRQAINAVSHQTGVIAEIGSGSNGAPDGALILKNAQAGDETNIVIDSFNDTGTGTNFTLTNGTYIADAHNTGQITLASTADPSAPFTLASPNHSDDTILNALGLGGGGRGFADAAQDGMIVFGAPPLNGELLINGKPLSTTPDHDKDSTIYATASATALWNAINSGQYGVRAEITPAFHRGQGPIHEGTMDSNDLKINGVSIFDGPVAILEKDADNTLVRAINAKTGETGVTASRDSSGQLVLTAVDGRNLHIETTAMGGHVTHLNNSDGRPDSRVYFGQVRLLADQPFSLESRDQTQPLSGFTMLGITGDDKNPTQLQVQTIHGDKDQVRYAGDRNNNISIKVGQHSIIEISKNGFDAIYDSGVFQILKELEHFLMGDRITQATSAATAYDLQQTLNSSKTGLALEERIGVGTFMVTIANHDSSPPTKQSYTISVDPKHDTLSDIAQRLNGIPGLKATWSDTSTNTDAPKKLQLAADPPGRFSFDLGNDTSGLLDAMGLEFDQIQASALQKSIADLDALMNKLTNQISDFGARANRIEVQHNIYMNLTVATAENLSELEDTDLMKAIMEIKAKEVAYQAALNVAARTMQLSLVDFL